MKKTILKKRYLALIALSTMTISHQASAWTVCTDSKVFDDASLAFIQANYCKVDNNYEGGMRPQPPVDDFCVFSGKCRDKLRSLLFADAMKKGNEGKLEFKKSKKAVEAMARIRTQLEKNHEKDAVRVWDNLIEASKNASVDVSELEKRYNNRPVSGSVEKIKLYNEGERRKAQIQTFVDDYKSKKIAIPDSWNQLMKKDDGQISNDDLDNVASEYYEGVKAYNDKQFDLLNQKRIKTENALSAKEIERRIASEQEGIEKNMKQLVISKCGTKQYPSDDEVAKCIQSNPDLGQRLEEARGEYERLAEAQEEMKESAKDSSKMIKLLLMSKDIFDKQYGKKGAKKLLAHMKGSVLGNMMFEIACMVKNDKNACDNAVGDKKINELYMNNKKINEYFKDTKGEIKDKEQ